jgi:hypothetical protein
LKYLDEFLAVFGDITLSQIVIIALAFTFLFLIYKEIKKVVDIRIEEGQKRAETETAYKKKIEESYSITQKYPEYHKESIQIRDSLKKEIKEIRDSFEAVMNRLEEIEEQNKKRECSKLRDMLLQNYRYYTNDSQNPSRSWTRMECEAFWELFREYEAAGGNGYMHTDVQPAMERLTIIEVGK